MALKSSDLVPHTGTTTSLMATPTLISSGFTGFEQLILPRQGLDIEMQVRIYDREHQGLINKIVYDMPDPHIGTGLSSSVETEGTVGKVVYKPYYTLENSEDITLQFESRFEGGNLKRATQIFPYEYDLEMRGDVGT
ncbi:MAG: hypothetical protein EZS28_002367 [Streblomastix strix]|uniref:Uncharacterized protein n=1 Tax=Streblomastix strix TaxID=222440 RepID=A0A5J4X4G5_9EUKA|nr:MAG: hypothetical protein EZS28_002367 [Streblomastix strix]